MEAGLGLRRCKHRPLHSFSGFTWCQRESVPFRHLQMESSPGLTAHRTENLKGTDRLGRSSEGFTWRQVSKV